MMMVFGSRKQSQSKPAKQVWGTTESQRRLERRLTGVNARFDKLRHPFADTGNEDLEAARQACDEVEFRRLVEEAERAIVVVGKAARIGGQELFDYLNAEIAAGRLKAIEKDHEAVIEAFHRKKQMERDEAERRRSEERFAREEPPRRAREIESLESRINQLALQIAAPLRNQLAKVPVDGKPRDYRIAIHGVERAIADVEK